MFTNTLAVQVAAVIVALTMKCARELAKNTKERNNSTITRDGKKYDIVLWWLCECASIGRLAASAKWNLWISTRL